MGMADIILIINPIHPTELKRVDLIMDTASKIKYPLNWPKMRINIKIGISEKSNFNIGNPGTDRYLLI